MVAMVTELTKVPLSRPLYNLPYLGPYLGPYLALLTELTKVPPMPLVHQGPGPPIAPHLAPSPVHIALLTPPRSPYLNSSG